MAPFIVSIRMGRRSPKQLKKKYSRVLFTILYSREILAVFTAVGHPTSPTPSMVVRLPQVLAKSVVPVMPQQSCLMADS